MFINFFKPYQMKRIAFFTGLFLVLMFTLASCGGSSNKNIELEVDNNTVYTMSQNGEVKIPFDVFPENANLTAMAIKCTSSTNRTNDPAVTSSLRSMNIKVSSIAMDNVGPNGRIATVLLYDADGKRFSPNASYFYTFTFKSCYLYVDKYTSNSFTIEYSYGN